jgi:hypothetical protein
MFGWSIMRTVLEFGMAEFAPVSTVADFYRLEEGDVLEGYLDGFSAAADPGSHRSRSYWHGWCNGRLDAGLLLPDLAQIRLGQAFEAMRSPARS